MTQETEILGIFTDEQAARLAGLTVSQLRRWDSEGFFTPSVADENRGRGVRLYNFIDLKCLRVIACLTGEYGVPLVRLRGALKGLLALDQSAWSTKTLYVLGRDVYFDENDTPLNARTGQYALPKPFPLQKIALEMRDAFEQMKRRDPDDFGQIVKARGVLGSAPIFRGTRIPVRVVQDFAAAGYSTKDILEQYPALTEKDVEAALRSGAQAA